MNLITHMVRYYWSRRSITTKFGFSFGLLLILMVGVIVGGYFFVNDMRHKAETEILTSMQIQRTVLEMDGDLEKARRLQRDFFLKYPEVGFGEAHDNFAVEALNEIANVVSLSDRLKSFIANPNASEALQKSANSLTLYHLAAQRYQQTFQESVELVTQLADSDTGLLQQLSFSSTDLYVALNQTSDLQWMDLYRQIQLDEKGYFISQQRSSMQNALNTAELLKQKIEFSPTLDTADKMIIIQKIAKYSSVAGQISDLNSTLRSKLTDFDLQSISIDPISKDLITLANDEVLYAQTQIDQTNQIGTTILVTTVLLGVLLSILVAMALNKSLTKNIVNLTQAASQLQAGNLAVNAPINSEDELGKLAKSFNSMAAQLQSSFTSIQASETRYRSLFEDSPISLWEEDCSVVKEHIEELRARGISDWDSYFDNHPDEGMELAGQVKVVDVNYATLEMFKVSHKEDLLNNITATFGPETMIIFRNELIAMASGMVDFQAETIFRTFDGEDIHVNLKINIVSGYENSWAKILVSMTDISELKRVYNQMRQLNDELEQRVQKRTAQLETANKDLESFAYSVSHDLRAPLRGMDGFSLALLEDYSERLDAQGRDYLKRIRATSQRMSQLIDDLLKLSRVTRSEIQLQKVNLSSMACTIEEELMYTQPQRQVVWQIADHLTATADAGLIHILLDNLMGNAFKFTSKVASARIELSSFDENGETVYWLRDNGAGFDMAYKDKLFGTFQRLHNASEFEGTGIGLALVQRVILRHGGRIWAESTPGKGATFYFTLSNHS